MADSASSSSGTASLKCSSDTEMMVQPKRAKIPKHGKVSKRQKHKMKLQSSMQKHYHKKQQSKPHSSTGSEHRRKKPVIKRKDPKKRKHKPSYSPSFGTSSTSEEYSDVSLDTDSLSSDESSSGQECTSRKVPKHSKPSAKHKRKKAKLSVKTSQASARNRQLRAVFKDHFAELMLLVSDPEQLAAQLYAKSLISPSTLEKIITLPTSRQQKNLHLLLDLDRKIRADPEKLFIFIDVIQKDPSLEEVGERMSGEATEVVTLEEEQKQSSAFSKHTSNTEGKIKGEVITSTSQSEESISTKQQKHQSLEDVDYTSVPRQLPPFSSAIAKYRHYLKSVYEARPTPMDDKLFINPCAQYINLAIVKKEPLSHEEADEFTRATLHGGIDQIFQKKKKVHLEDIFVTEDDHESPLKCILVEGPPGIGKSTFAWELCRKWNTLEVMQKYILVVLIRLREKRVQNAKYLFELFSHPSDPTLSQAVVGEILEGEHVLLILDGFDEFPASLLDEDNSLVRQIVGGSCLPKATVVVTSRPSAKASIAACQCKVSKHIEIIGFTEEDRVKYAQNAFTSHPDMLVYFLKYSFSNPTIKAMMYIPLNCAIVTQIYKNCMCGSGGKKLIPKTMTQLYTALCHSLLRRYLVENSLVNRDYRMPQELNNLPEDVCKHLHTLSEIAFDGIEQQKLVFYKHELPEGFQHMGFMNECRELYVDRGVESSYNFLHLSLQEYLAAWHVSQLPDIEQKRFFLGEGRHHLLDVAMVKRFKARIIGSGMSVVKKFLAGITGFRSAVWQDILQSEADELIISDLMHTCLYETQNRILCQQLLCSSVIKFEQLTYTRPISFSNHSILPSKNLHNSVDFYALGYCITHSKSAWKIKARNYSGVEALEMLVSGMNNEPKYHLPTGWIQSFDISNMDLGVGVAWLKKFPWSILFQLSELTLSGCYLCPKSCQILAQAIPMMPNLRSLDISYNDNIGPGGAVRLLESLCSLKHLECLRIIHTRIGISDAKALIALIGTSKTLRHLHFSNTSLFTKQFGWPILFNNSRLVNMQGFVGMPIMNSIIFSALAVESLNEICFYEVTISNAIQLSSLLPSNSSITNLNLYGGLQNDCLAYLSQALHTSSHLTNFSIQTNMNGLKFSKAECMVLLNNALEHNTGLRTLMVKSTNHGTESTRVSDIYELQCLAHQLRRGPSGPQLKLKRAYSCPCLMKQNDLPFPAFQPNPRLKRYCSAPDFTITESISSLHPCLINLLNISRFYWNEKEHNNFLKQQFENFIDDLFDKFQAARK